MDLRTPLVPRPSRTTPAIEGSPGCRRSIQRRERLNTELLTAILKNNIHVVERTLEKGGSVDATCRRSRTTALQLAVVLGNLAVSKLLLAKGAQPRRRDRAGRQAVHLAAAVGVPALLALLLDADSTSVDSPVGTIHDLEPQRDCLDSWAHDHALVTDMIPELSKGATPLHIAAQRLHCECVQELLRRGGRVDVHDRRGLTPLDVIGEGSVSSPQHHLPSHQTTCRSLTSDVMPTPNIDNALARIETTRKMISGEFADSGRLSELMVVSSKKNLTSSSPSEMVTQITINLFSSDTSAQMVASELIHKGAKLPRSTIEQGEVINQLKLTTTCLHTAVERQDCPLVEHLLDQGACMVTWNKEGLTAIHLAVSKCLLDPLRVLLERDKSRQVVDSRDSQGQTPLHLAVAEGWCPGVSLLLEAGADVQAVTSNSDTVLHIASRSSQLQTLKGLLEVPDCVQILDHPNIHQETPLFCATSTGSLACVRHLIGRGANVTVSLPGDVTLLHVAAERGDSALLAELLKHIRMTAFRNVRTKSKEGATALHLAALGGHLECVQLLVDAGCDLLAVTSNRPHYGSTALHLAAYRGHERVVEFIVRWNRNTLRVRNADGWYPLHVAARFGKEQCIRTMLLHGANLAATVQDSEGCEKTALDIITYSIVHPDAFLEEIFDSYMQVNDYPLNNPKCVVKLKFDLLQPLGAERKQLRVLDSLLNCRKHVVQDKLLLHPLVETFLYLKWMKLRVFFFVIMALYFVFTLSLTTMAMIFYVFDHESALTNKCIHGSRISLFGSLTFIILQEMLQAARMQRYYVKDLESWLKWSGFLLASLVVVTPHLAPWMVHVAAVAVLLSWLELLFLLSRWPSSIGFYILMFFTVTKNVLRVFATFTFVILGFTFAFMIQFGSKAPFETWWESLVKVLVMTLEFDYDDLFQDVQGMAVNSVVGHCMFLLFVVLVPIVLMNLLVGLAVSDIAALEQQGRAQRLAKQIDFLSMLEIFVYNRPLFACIPRRLSGVIVRCRAAEPFLKVEPGKPTRKTHRCLPEQLKQNVLSNVTNRIIRTRGYSRKEAVQKHEETGSSESNDSSSSSSSSFSVKSSELTLGEISFEENLKNTLENIMNDLSFIKHELKNLKESYQ